MREKSLLHALSLLTIVVALLWVPAAGADPLTESVWHSTVTVANVSSQVTDIWAVAIPANEGDSSRYYTPIYRLWPGDSVVIVPGAQGAGFLDFNNPRSLPSGFVGSVVVNSQDPYNSANHPSIAVVGSAGNNRVLDRGVEGGYAVEQFTSLPPAESLYFPLYKHQYGGKSTFAVVQAAVNSGAPVPIHAIFSSPAGEFTYSGEILPQRSIALAPTDFSPPIPACGSSQPTPNSAPCIGSLTVHSLSRDGRLTGVIFEHQTSVVPATALQSATMFRPNDSGARVFCPVLKNRFPGSARPSLQRTSGLTVFNTGLATANVRLTFRIAEGTEVGGVRTLSDSIPAGKSKVYSPFTGNVGGLPDYTLASVLIESLNQEPLLAAMNESNFPSVPEINQKQTVYNCAADSNTGDVLTFPLVKESYGGSTTGLTVQNAGATTVTAKFTWDCGSSSTSTNFPVAANGGAVTVLGWLSGIIPANQLCSVTVNSPGAWLLGIGQESSDLFGGALNTKNYEAHARRRTPEDEGIVFVPSFAVSAPLARRKGQKQRGCGAIATRGDLMAAGFNKEYLADAMPGVLAVCPPPPYPFSRHDGGSRLCSVINGRGGNHWTWFKSPGRYPNDYCGSIMNCQYCEEQNGKAKFKTLWGYWYNPPNPPQ